VAELRSLLHVLLPQQASVGRRCCCDVLLSQMPCFPEQQRLLQQQQQCCLLLLPAQRMLPAPALQLPRLLLQQRLPQPTQLPPPLLLQPAAAGQQSMLQPSCLGCVPLSSYLRRPGHPLLLLLLPSQHQTGQARVALYRVLLLLAQQPHQQ
jgi:hypothetical protein